MAVLLLCCALSASLTMLIRQSLNYAAYREQEFIAQSQESSSQGGRGAGDETSNSAANKAPESDEVQSDVPAADTSVEAEANVDEQGRIDLNTASLEQLDAITGVGPVIAQRILDYRLQIGRFSSVDQLLDVSGIGPKTLEKMRDQVVVR